MANGILQRIMYICEEYSLKKNAGFPQQTRGEESLHFHINSKFLVTVLRGHTMLTL